MTEKKYFSFLKHYCLQCKEEIHLNVKRLGRYEREGYPEYHSGHKKKFFKKEQGDFCFLPHYCQCGCKNKINLIKNRIVLYELNKYPKYILGHKSKVIHKNQVIFGNFCYLPNYCACPDHELMELSKKEICNYERCGYPKFIRGHSHKINHPLSIAKGNFEFIPYKCSCGCNEYIKLNPKNFSRYEKYGYPKFKKGHNSRCSTEQQKINMSKAQIIVNNNPERKKKQSEIMKGNKYFKNHKHTEEFKENRRKYKSPRWTGGIIHKRRRRKENFKWNPLNPIIGNGKIIKGYERHHVNYNDFIYVPKDYNQGISHNIYTGYNMLKVNTMAYFFLIMNYISELNKLFKI